MQPTNSNTCIWLTSPVPSSRAPLTRPSPRIRSTSTRPHVHSQPPYYLTRTPTTVPYPPPRRRGFSTPTPPHHIPTTVQPCMKTMVRSCIGHRRLSPRGRPDDRTPETGGTPRCPAVRYDDASLGPVRRYGASPGAPAHAGGRARDPNSTHGKQIPAPKARDSGWPVKAKEKNKKKNIEGWAS